MYIYTLWFLFTILRLLLCAANVGGLWPLFAFSFIHTHIHMVWFTKLCCLSGFNVFTFIHVYIWLHYNGSIHCIIKSKRSVYLVTNFRLKIVRVLDPNHCALACMKKIKTNLCDLVYWLETTHMSFKCIHKHIYKQKHTIICLRLKVVRV